MFYKYFINKIKLFNFRKKWRKENKHNLAIATNIFPINLVKVGKYTYGPLDIRSWKVKNEGLEIGNYVSIAEGVKFLLSGNHFFQNFTTYPIKTHISLEKNATEVFSKGKIIIKDDVWIGSEAMILSGVIVEQGAIIAARSVVTKAVPAYSIVAGNPAKVVKYRFSQEIIDELKKVDFSKIKKENFNTYKNELYKEIDSLDKVKKLIFLLQGEKFNGDKLF